MFRGCTNTCHKVSKQLNFDDIIDLGVQPLNVVEDKSNNDLIEK